MPIPFFDGLWYIIVKLFSKKGDGVANQGAVRITVIKPQCVGVSKRRAGL